MTRENSNLQSKRALVPNWHATLRKREVILTDLETFFEVEASLRAAQP